MESHASGLSLLPVVAYDSLAEDLEVSYPLALFSCACDVDARPFALLRRRGIVAIGCTALALSMLPNSTPKSS